MNTIEEPILRRSPLVSVIMNCRNCDKYLKEAVESVLKQSYQNWEVIFWDNQSTDNSAIVFEAYKDSRLRYHLAPEFTPLGEARNLAMKKAKGEFIAFLDCDDIWLPRKLEKQIPVFDRENIGLVICDTIFFNDKRNIRQIYKKKKPPVGKVFKELLASYFVSLETTIIRTSVLYKLDHWFDTRFDVIEEYDFFVRIGYEFEVGYVDEVLSKWRVHSASWTWSRPELFPAETELFVEKMKRSIPNFHEDFAEEIQTLEIKIAIQRSIIAWRDGKTSLARKTLAPFMFKNIFATLIVVWSFLLPYETFDFINKVRVGLRE